MLIQSVAQATPPLGFRLCTSKPRHSAPAGLEPDGFRGDDFDEELGLYGNKALTRDAWHVSAILRLTATTLRCRHKLTLERRSSDRAFWQAAAGRHSLCHAAQLSWVLNSQPSRATHPAHRALVHTPRGQLRWHQGGACSGQSRLGLSLVSQIL